MIEFTKESVQELARKAVESKPEGYIYTRLDGTQADRYKGCFNWEHNSEGEIVPGCIVGTILHLGGINLETITNDGGWEDSIRELEGVATFDRWAERFFERAQGLQDIGTPWSKAVIEATEYTNRL